MDWAVEWDERAFRELESLDKQAQRNILTYLRKKIQTEEDPRRFGAPLHDDLAGPARFLAVLIIAISSTARLFSEW